MYGLYSGDFCRGDPYKFCWRVMEYNHKDKTAIIAEIERQSYEPNEWEMKFLESISDREEKLTGKQSACLDRIYEKAVYGKVDRR